ncbi:CCA tRNA nucleotidyltransferase [Clostridium gasigenes]|uniref:CCA tRNA nucleotidyltransferase n=1 Tax=Clostridium gasigenes TaxID=94869 RepID=UPI0014382DA3|nr:CCA tRNA nucleotidyltransferase [Clostridium gasigenes]NKF05747.1 CCA tRNA nucleotidyltransferase [Clostridium gasigenes]QSW19519.1 CCA tRNA nucleotidyltransferase [Clostridium gasigenes]
MFNEINGAKIDIPNKYLDFVRILDANGINSYFVGGCVRDYLVGVEYNDFDIFYKCTKEYFKSKIKGLRYVEDFKNVLIVENGNYEIYAISFTKDFEGDFKSRDNTINSIYYNWKNETIFGFLKSFQDLKDKRISPCNKEVFIYDSFKILRSIRFSNKLNFDFDFELKYIENMDLKDIDTEFSAYRILNEVLKHDEKILSIYGLTNKIIKKMNEFEIYI